MNFQKICVGYVQYATPKRKFPIYFQKWIFKCSLIYPKCHVYMK